MSAAVRVTGRIGLAAVQHNAGARENLWRAWLGGVDGELDTVDDVDAAVERALRAGAILEAPARDAPYGRIAMLGDPFGHGFCLLAFGERGYDALVGG